MKALIASIIMAVAVAASSFASTTNAVADVVITNVVTNVLFETRVKWDVYPVTNGSYVVYGGTLTTNRVYDVPLWTWKNGKLELATNYVDMVTAGTTTSTVYDVEWKFRPEYYQNFVTNVFTNIFVNGINQR